MRSGRGALRLLQPLVPSSPGGMVILLYHLVGAETDSPVDLPVEVFRAQMEELRDSARVVPLAAGLERVQVGSANGPTTVVVTFDDAYESFVSRAMPVLEELKIPATLYIPVGFVDRTAPAPIRGTGHLRPASWGALREAIASGLVTPGSHTLTHPDLRRLSPEDARNEVTRSREILADRLGADVETFAYPRALAPRWLTETVRDHYRTAVLDGGVKIRRGSRWNPHALPRFPIRRDGPRRLAPVLRTSVWLEEWIASRLRRLRPSQGRPSRRVPLS